MRKENRKRDVESQKYRRMDRYIGLLGRPPNIRDRPIQNIHQGTLYIGFTKSLGNCKALGLNSKSTKKSKTEASNKAEV